MNDIMVLDTDFKIVGVIDTYESFIWTDRFDSPGDFELYTPYDDYILSICKENYYLAVNTSVHNMIIESTEIQTDAETGVHVTIKGRSLESILDRRIVWNQTTISSTKDHNLITGVNTLLADAFIRPTDATVPERAVSNFYIKKPESNFVDKEGNEFQIEKTQFTGDELESIIGGISATYEVGFRILFGYQMKKLYSSPIQVWSYNTTSKKWEWVNRTPEDYDFIFEMYVGVDRSYAQTNLPYVVFSPGFDNIINSNYVDNIADMKNVVLVLGEGDGSKRKRVIVGEGSGLLRREYYSDSRDLQSKDYGNNNAKYREALRQRGSQKLTENSRVTSYEGEVDALSSFVYGEDFFLGDIIQISNEFGKNGNAKVIEWVRSESEEGIDAYPTFNEVQIINTDAQDDDEDE